MPLNFNVSSKQFWNIWHMISFNLKKVQSTVNMLSYEILSFAILVKQHSNRYTVSYTAYWKTF